jgi:hypothetical protein
LALSDAVPFATAAYPLSDLTDSVGALDLTNNNSAAFVAGKLGNAVDLELGSEQYLYRADDAAFDLLDTDWMIRCWANVESNPGFRLGVVAKYPGNGGYSLRWEPAYTGGNNRYVFQVHDGTNPSAEAISNEAISLSTWDLIHVWHDATNNLLGISVNAGTAATAAHSTGVANNASAFMIGRVEAVYSYFDGMIDDVVILNGYILDATERTADYNSGSGVAFADWAGGGGGAAGMVVPRRGGRARAHLLTR